MGASATRQQDHQAPSAGEEVSPTEPVTNSDVFLWALFELGGADEFVDVEAVFIKAFELAPLRLSWRTRPDLPDLKKCSKALRDAEGQEKRARLGRIIGSSLEEPRRDAGDSDKASNHLGSR